MATDRRVRVLCVDDNRDLADSEAELLRLVGYDPRSCYDGAAALAVAREFDPDVCLLDLNLPGMDGDELAVRLRRVLADHRVRMVAVTAMGNDESIRRTREAGFDCHLVKPVLPAELLRVIDRLKAEG